MKRFTLVFFAGCLLSATVSAEDLRITRVANVSVRQEPSTSAPILVMIPLGTEVTVLGQGGAKMAWDQIELRDRRRGWVLDALTTPLPENRRTAVLEKIVVDRLARQGDGFSALTELVDLIERAGAAIGDRETRGRFALYRLRALANTLATVNTYVPSDPVVAAWLDTRRDLAGYDEPDGRWVVTLDAILAEQERQSGTRAADDIAWLAGGESYGECEGDVSCYLDRVDQLRGTYVRAFPSGRHVSEALDDIAAMLTRVAAPADQGPYFFEPARDCANTLKTREALHAAIAAVPPAISARRAAMTASDALQQRCR